MKFFNPDKREDLLLHTSTYVNIHMELISLTFPTPETELLILNNRINSDKITD